MYINMTPDNTNKTLHASQDDTNRQFKFKLYNDSQVLDTSDSIPPVIFDVEPNGIEQLLPVNSSSPTTSPIIADIKYPDELREDQEFFERITPTTLKGQAKVKKIKGNTIVWNQLIQNGNFADSSVWTINADGTLSVSNNEGAVTLSNVPSNNFTPNIRQQIGIDFIQGHKYLFTLDVYLPHNSYFRIEFGGSGFGETTPSRINANTWTTVSFIIQRTNAATTRNAIFYPPYATGVWSANDVWKIRNVNVFDLTQMFGAGNEPTSVSDFTDLFPLISYYDYNAGSLLSFNGSGIKTTGKNLLALPVVAFDTLYNLPLSGYFLILKGTYTLSYTANANHRYIIKMVDANGNYLSDNAYKPNLFVYWSDSYQGWFLGSDRTAGSFTFSVNIVEDCYIRIGRSYTNPDTIELTNVQLELGSTATDYVPYSTNTLSLPTSTYFPTGMKSAGTIYDELTPTKAITRIGSVDLGSLEWAYTAGGSGRFQTTGIASSVKIPSTDTGGNIKCAKYINGNASQVYSGTAQICIQNGTGQIWIYDPSFNGDISAFKTAMLGVYLYYELATPTEEDIESCSLVSEDIEKPLEYDDGFLVCDSEGLTSKAGFIPCKVKKVKGDQTIYSQLINLHVERRP